MGTSAVNIHALDAAYKPFPTFEEWALKTSIDTARWDRYTAPLKNRPDSSAEAFSRAREVVKRAAALDTGAIEGLYEVDRGFTFTVAMETAAWEVELAKKGENVRPLFEAQLHAYDYVLDLATKAEPISEAAIRTLHEVVCKAQATYRVMTAVGPQEQKLVKGRYKILPNHVRTRDGVDHSYAPVDVTPAEMQRLVQEMRGEAFLAAHPVIQAAYAHYGLVVIHPFPDGNGRVARALASVFTYRAISMPIMILSEHKNAYLNALETADRGEFQSFVSFMLVRSLDTISLVNESALNALVPSPEEGAAAVSGLFITRGGFTQGQVDAAGKQLLQRVLGELTTVVSRTVGPNLSGNAVLMLGIETAPGLSHRLPVGQERGLSVHLQTSPPAQSAVSRQYALWLPIDAGGDDDVQLVLGGRPETITVVGRRRVAVTPPEPSFSARMDELTPSISGVLQLRIALFAERVVGEMLAELQKIASKYLRGES